MIEFFISVIVALVIGAVFVFLYIQKELKEIDEARQRHLKAWYTLRAQYLQDIQSEWEKNT